MVLKCLNHIYRLSTDVMFLTWSPFVWMKINWRQMRNPATRMRDSGWIVASPGGHSGESSSDRETTSRWGHPYLQSPHLQPSRIYGMAGEQQSILERLPQVTWTRDNRFCSINHHHNHEPHYHHLDNNHQELLSANLILPVRHQYRKVKDFIFLGVWGWFSRTSCTNNFIFHSLHR